jgi:hypothetical protein
MNKPVKWEVGFMSSGWGKTKAACLLSYVGTPYTQCASHSGKAHYSVVALLLGYGRKQKVIFCMAHCWHIISSNVKKSNYVQ